MSKSFLIIVEGKVTEKDIFEQVLTKYGFEVLCKDKINVELSSFESVGLKRSELVSNKDSVIIVQGPRNRIRDLLLHYDRNQEDYDRLFNDYGKSFAGVFFVYDVDHATKEELSAMFEKYKDETSGMLLVSSPCIEVLSQPYRTEELSVEHLTEYKKQLNVAFAESDKKSAKQYIIDNFNSLILQFIDMNTRDSGLQDVMQHPAFVVEEINKQNTRTYVSKDVIPVKYRYFTTVVYVCIAYMLGLTKEFENVEQVKQFFQQYV